MIFLSLFLIIILIDSIRFYANYYLKYASTLGNTREFVCNVEVEGGQGVNNEPEKMSWKLNGKTYDNTSGYVKVRGYSSIVYYGGLY